MSHPILDTWAALVAETHTESHVMHCLVVARLIQQIRELRGEVWWSSHRRMIGRAVVRIERRRR